MVDAVDTPTKTVDLAQIVDLAKQISEAARTVDQNEDVCKQIGRHATRVVAMLSWLTSTMTTTYPAMSSALEDLQGALHRALHLVLACQEKTSGMCLFFTAGKLSKELRQVNEEMRRANQDVVDQMGIANVNNVQNTIMISTQYSDGRPVVQDSELVGSSPSSHFIDDTSGRSEVRAAKESVAGVSEDAPLPSVGLKSFSLAELEAATNGFSDENVIAKGGFATVYEGVLPDGLVVAIRRYGHGSRHPEHYAYIFSLQHTNLIRFLGFQQSFKKKVGRPNGRYVVADVQNGRYGPESRQPAHYVVYYVVHEFTPNGSLQDFIDGWSPEKLDWPSTFRVIEGIAQGVAYLHTKDIIHLDLKPDNVLLDSGMNPKICGFEISQKLNQEDAETRTDELAGTRYYMAPEYVRSGIVSVKNDMYAFGVLLLATISAMSKSGLQENSVDWARKVWKARTTTELSDPSLYDESQLNEIEKCIEIGLACTQVNRERRPAMPVVLELLKGKEKLPTLSNEDARSDDAPVTHAEPRSFSFSELEAATNNFSDENLIAEGRIATVYKGVLSDGSVVAIKRFPGPSGPQSARHYRDVSSKLRPHKNVVTVLGYCYEVGRETVVEDYMPSRSLSTIIDASPQKMELDWAARFRIIQGIADGVAHLHAAGIIHFDLAPANIVIFDEHMNPKICDFGLSKILNEGESETGTEGFEFAAGSKAPEYNEDGVISVKNDVYSFGDLLRTFCGMSRPGPPKDLNDLARVVQEARRMKEFFDPSSCSGSQLKEIKRCMDIALLCTQMEPRYRPTMRRTLSMLSNEKKVPSPKRNNVSSKKKR